MEIVSAVDPEVQKKLTIKKSHNVDVCSIIITVIVDSAGHCTKWYKPMLKSEVPKGMFRMLRLLRIVIPVAHLNLIMTCVVL